MEVAMPRIRHVHSRSFAADADRVASVVERMWSGTERDAFPWDFIRPTRSDPPGARGFVPGASTFGHGPFRFTLEQWDGRVFRARVDTPGFEGSHGFVLEPTASGCRVTHDLDAQVAFAPWAVWKAVVGSAHDWAVEAIFDRMAAVLETGRAPTRTARLPPSTLRLSKATSRLRRRVRAR
jgi:hypothetical protein